MEEPGLFESIYNIVRKIPRGKVTTYGQISRMLGRCSAQMIGFALAALPKRKGYEDVPWQRVINAKGKISPHGYGYGTNMQRILLEDEGILFNTENEIDLNVFGWDETLQNH